MMLLIRPPIAKPSEPPACLAQLAGCLRHHGIACTLLDANLEGLLFLLGQARDPEDTWSTRALRHRDATLAALHTEALYQNSDRYQRAVRDCNRVLELAARSHPELAISLANYQDNKANPLDSGDLLRAAEDYQSNLFFPWYRHRLPALLEATHPHYIGISLSYISQALCTFALLGFLKAHYPQVKLILGGGLITSWMSNTNWRSPFAGLVEQCIAGPGEGPLLKLFGLEDQTPNLPPDYSDLPVNKYLAPGPILPYAASRGCYWNKCSFCPETAEQNRYRPVPPATVLSHLHQLCAQVRPALIHLLDNAASPALLRAFCDDPPGVPWYSFVCVHEQLANVDFCRQLRLSGCVLLKLGIESGSQRVLDAMNKGVQLDLIERVLAALHQAGIATYVYLLFGTPAESVLEARETLALTLRHHQAITFLNLAIFNMPRASEEARLLPVAKCLARDLSLYRDFVHPRGWDRRSIRAFLDREFKRHPAIGTIIRRDPPLFTSNHAAFFSGAFSLLGTGQGSNRGVPR